jgi:hypothetical protein
MIRKVSKKREILNAEYKIARLEFLAENKKCAVYPNLDSTEIHHKKGRIGKLLIDKRYFLAVSRLGHIFIENNPNIAREKGWILNRFEKNGI